MDITVFLWCMAVVIGVAVLTGLCYTKQPIRRLLSSTLQGACALAAVNVVGMVSGVSLGLNVLTILTCVVAGVPGVITLLLLKVIFAI